MVRQANSSVLRIGYLMQNGGPDLNTVSGPQLHTVAVIKGLAKRGHQVRTMAFQREKLGWSDDLQNWTGPQFGYTASRNFHLIESPIRRVQHELKLPYIGIFDSLRYADACYEILKGYDILYERHGFMGYGGLIAARRLGIPIIIELNGNILKEIDEIGLKMSTVQRYLSRWITYRTLSAADHVVVVSEALKRELLAAGGIPQEKISVVLNGVNLDLFSRVYHEKDIRVQYGIGSSPLIVFVGSFQPWHGVDLLVSSFRLVQSRFSEAQLALIGDGRGRDAVENQIAELGLRNVKLLGRLAQDQVAAVLSIADVVVAPYPFNHTDIVGTPLKLLEYMAAGKAIVASTAPIHEVIEDGVTGLRVPSANAAALADGICRLVSDSKLRATLGANARSRAQQYYSWDRVVEKLEAILKIELSHKLHNSLTSNSYPSNRNIINRQ